MWLNSVEGTTKINKQSSYISFWPVKMRIHIIREKQNSIFDTPTRFIRKLKIVEMGSAKREKVLSTIFSKHFIATDVNATGLRSFI